MIGGRNSDHPSDLAVIFCTVVVVGVLGFGVVAGVSQPIDPRVMASEAVSNREREVGLLAASATGPPGIAGMLLGVGLAAGMWRSAEMLPVVIAAALAWLAALLLLARTATNLLGVMSSRFPRAGQLLVGLAGLVFYGLFQFIPALLGGLDDGERARVADAMAMTPPGQAGRAMTTSSTGPALLHLLAAWSWIPFLALAFGWSTRRLTVSVRRAGGLETADVSTHRIRAAVRSACGDGPVGAVAWRSIVTRFRTPRSALETFTGAGVGLAAVLIPVLVRDSAGSGAVLVGGAVQLAVLFMSGNSFGIDGPAVTHEMLAGGDASTLATGKARSILIVASPLAVIGPLLAAGVTGEWRYSIAGFGVGIGSLFAGTGAAIVQSTLVPIAIPESDNPFASGESGKGIIAALLLGVVLVGLAIATVPIALALFWATDRGNVSLVTVFGAASIVIGYGLLRVGIAIATRRLSGHEPEFIAAVTPTR
jgi:hypothetical protein